MSDKKQYNNDFYKKEEVIKQDSVEELVKESKDEEPKAEIAKEVLPVEKKVVEQPKPVFTKPAFSNKKKGKVILRYSPKQVFVDCKGNGVIVQNTDAKVGDIIEF